MLLPKIIHCGKVSYKTLVLTFLNQHDPVLPRSTQYRSAAFYLNEAQQTTILAEFEEYEKNCGHELATHVAPLTSFYRAEEYHQKFLKKKGMLGRF